MNESVYHFFFVAAFLGMIGIRVVSHRSTARSRGSFEYKEGRLNMAVRGVAGISYILAVAVYLVYPRYLHWAGFPLPAWVRWLGAGLAVASIGLLGWVHRALGQNFSTTLHVREKHTLITHGPYRWVRHPMYTALIIFFVGVLLLSANWVIGLPGLVAAPFFLIARIGKEEAAMLDLFNDEYCEYMKRTGRFLPRLNKPG